MDQMGRQWCRIPSQQIHAFDAQRYNSRRKIIFCGSMLISLLTPVSLPAAVAAKEWLFYEGGV
uniref:Uncharacterized protein n=1 Tax=Triticum urartu TaxID=4572 RepID=A0A8R7U5K6_TRIUA